MPKTLKLTLPWPPADLSPNKPGHWARKAKAKKAYRTACKAISEASEGQGTSLGPDDALGLVLRFYPPTKAVGDWDNYLARMKSGLDGVAEGLGVNDALFRPSVEVMPSEGKEKARVEVEIYVV